MCNNPKTSWSVDCLIGSRWFLWDFWVKCLIPPLISSDFRINLCFNNILEQQGVGLKKPHMHIDPKYFDWMVSVINIFQLLAGTRRNKHKCAWPNHLSTQMASLISKDSWLSCFISCYMCHHRPSAQEIWLSWLLLWNFEPDWQNFVAGILDFWLAA